MLAWGILAAAGPLIIHWIHQNRHRTLRWAATLFLQRKNSSSARWSKLKQWLLLAARTLAVAALTLSFSRPITGTWLPSWLEAPPECVVLVLDRSGSMEAPVTREAGESRGGGPAVATKRSHALALWQKAAAHTRTDRWIFFENVLKSPLELANLAGLDGLPLAGPTDTAANIPALLLSAARHLESQQIGRAEIWIASDMQASNWKTDAPEWEVLREKMAAWKGATLLRLLDLSTPRSANVALSLRELQTRVVHDPDRDRNAVRLSLKLRFTTQPPEAFEPEKLPFFLNLYGAVSNREIPRSSAQQTHVLIPPSLPLEAGWGSARIPADGHLPDNAAYFAWPTPRELRALVVGEGDGCQKLRLACAPDPESGRTRAEVLPLHAFSAAALPAVDLLVWNAGPLPHNVARQITPWIREGGILLQLPPGTPAASAPNLTPAQNLDRDPGHPVPTTEPAGTVLLPQDEIWLPPAWSPPESGSEPYAVTLWEEADGPLARTESGQSLPVASVEIRMRQIPVPARPGVVTGTFGDGRPFFLRQALGRGAAYALSTGVEEAWSSLGEGTVLVPVLQRLLLAAAQQRQPVSMAVAGEWHPGPEETWVPVPVDGLGDVSNPTAGARTGWVPDPRWKAGVYQLGSRWMALNRAEAEDDADQLPASDLAGMLPGVPLRTLEKASALSTEELQNELWPALGSVLVFLLCAEMALCWLDHPPAPSRSRGVPSP